MGEMMILGRVLEPSKPADGLLGAWRFGSCIADEIVLLHHSDGTFRLTATVRTDHSETSHSVLLAPSPKVAESRWLVRAREHAPSLYEIMAAETARADALRGGGAVLTQREFLSIAARLPWMTLGELEARPRIGSLRGAVVITRETDPLTTALECERRAGLIEDMLSIPDVEITERQRAEGLREIGIAEWRVKRTDYGWRVSVEWIDNSERKCSATGRDSVIGTAWAVVLGMVQRALQAEARELREMAEEEAA